MSKYIGEREIESFEKQCELIRRLGITNPMIFDVGANTGQSVEKYKNSFPESTIHSFEPNPSMFEKLDTICDKDKWINIHKVAMNSNEGVFKFHITNAPEASSLLHPDPELMRMSRDNKYGFTTIDIKCTTLDKFVKDNDITRIDILKLDVQGSELEVLKGARNFLKQKKIILLFIEVNFAETYTDQFDFKDMLILLNKYDYKLWDLSPFLYTDSGRLWYANSIFIHDDSFKMIAKQNQI